jgi:hypothetical protein
MHILGICTAYLVYAVAKVNRGYRCAFCMGKSVTLPTFFRRSIGDPVQLSPTPIGDPRQLFRDPCELHPGKLLQIAANCQNCDLRRFCRPRFSFTTTRLKKKFLIYLTCDGAGARHLVWTSLGVCLKAWPPTRI